jgi:prophage regulatory protein
MTGLGRASIYAKMALGQFPASVDLGPRSVAWVRSEIEDWIAAQIAKSRNGAEAPSRKLPQALRDRQQQNGK